MFLSASKFSTNILVTVLVILFVVLLPIIDKKTCDRLQINPTHRRTGNSREVKLLRLREIVFYFIFFMYLAIYAYLVFFSRSANEDYLVHVKPLNDLINSVRIDSGIVGVLTTIYSQGLSSGLSQIHIEKVEDIAQIYMNIMLFVPMGYLLPYVFDYIQRKVRIRPVLYCFIISFITENLQLIFKLGFYDLDDIIANTFGGFIGQSLYISLAYIVEQPNWKKAIADSRKWKKMARKSILFPFANQISIFRTTILASNRSVIFDYYIGTLGFMLFKQIPGDNEKRTSYILKMGNMYLEILLADSDTEFYAQYISIGVKNIIKVQNNFKKKGIDTTELNTDASSSLRKFSINAPDNVTISFFEV